MIYPISPDLGDAVTLLAVLSGLLAARRGSARYNEQELLGLAPEALVARGISHVPQGRRLFAGLSVEQNLRLGTYSRRWRR